MLCGHTHGGQISFKGKWSPTAFTGIDMKYLTGVVKDGPTTVIVSNGIGTVGIPLRICAAPQIWIIKLEKQNVTV
jgi:predicted MPP superfamily phosphohydrolase